MARTANSLPLKEKLAIHLASGGTIEAFARSNPERTARTYYEWAADPDLRRKVEGILTDRREGVAKMLATGAIKAAKRLFDLLDSTNERVQLEAAKAIVDRSRAAWEDVEIDRRLTELESRADHAK